MSTAHSLPKYERPPRTPGVPVEDSYHGTTVVDQYRWLEDPNTPATQRWSERQSEYTRAVLDTLPHRERLRDRVAELSSRESILEPHFVNGRCFFLKRSHEEEQHRLFVREGLWDDESLLLDPATLGSSPEVSLSILSISTDARILALGVRIGSGGGRSVRFLDVDSRELLPDSLAEGAIRGITILPDGRGVFYIREALPRGRHGKCARIHRFGEPPERDRIVYWAGNSDCIRLLGTVDCRSCTAVYEVIQHANAHVSYSVCLQRLSQCGTPVLSLFERAPYSPNVRIHNGMLWCRRVDGAIISTDLQNPEFDRAEVVRWLPEGPTRWHLVADRLVIESVEDCYSVVRVFTQDGAQTGHVPQPGAGTVTIVGSAARYLFFTWQSYINPPKLYICDLETLHTRPFSQVDEPTSDSLSVRRMYATGLGGAQVPLTALARPETFANDTPAPTVLTGYGAHGVSFTPQYSQFATIVVEQGGVFAIAHVRGGGECGSSWHEAGRRLLRSNTHADFLACAELLIADRVTDVGKLALAGGSAGGLLVGVALTQRPDLFRCVICVAPLLDMLRYHRYQNTQFYVEEFGDPGVPEDFNVLYSYSPYHRVQDGVHYPALLVVAGGRDMRCDSMHARKFVARMQAAMLALSAEQQAPVLLDFNDIRGHHPVLSRSLRINSLTDRLAFLFDQLGVSVSLPQRRLVP